MAGTRRLGRTAILAGAMVLIASPASADEGGLQVAALGSVLTSRIVADIGELRGGFALDDTPTIVMRKRASGAVVVPHSALPRLTPFSGPVAGLAGGLARSRFSDRPARIVYAGSLFLRRTAICADT